MLLSKRAEMFLPEQWPAYFSKAKGCRVWDLDGNEYLDMSLMGIGTNILGYGQAEVDAAVHATIDAGNMSTLNCPEEVYLAEQTRGAASVGAYGTFARTGGEADAIAVRIARAATGRDKLRSAATMAGTIGTLPPISAMNATSPGTCCRALQRVECRAACAARCCLSITIALTNSSAGGCARPGRHHHGGVAQSRSGPGLSRQSAGAGDIAAASC